MSAAKLPKIELWDIDKIAPYENNVKKHGLEQVAKIAESIKRHGWDQPIVVDRNGVIIKGHGRRLAAIELGLKRVPVICRTDLSDDDAKAARLADNRVAISDYDTEMLKVELQSISQGLEGIFDDKELEFMNADLGAMNIDAFVTNMDTVVQDQKQDLQQRADNAAKGSIPLSRAFGIKSVPAASQLQINRLMAAANAAGKDKGLTGAEALIAWIDNNITEDSQS
jgi:hypothetical protein